MIRSLLFLAGGLTLLCLSNGYSRYSYGGMRNARQSTIWSTLAIGDRKRFGEYRFSNIVCKAAELEDDSTQVYSDGNIAYFEDVITLDQNDKDSRMFLSPSMASVSISNELQNQGETSMLATSSPLISKSFLVLNAVAIIWGTQHVVIKTSLENFPSPSVLNFWRFSLSFLLFLPAFISVLVSTNH